MSEATKRLIRQLTAINLDDMQTALGWQRASLVFAVFRPWLRPLAAALAHRVTQFNDTSQYKGLALAAADFLRLFVTNWRAIGVGQIPLTGPVLLVSNHPGMVDTLLLLAAIPRADLRVVAADRPFLRAIPAAESALLFVQADQAAGFRAMREAVRHVAGGGALLTFPAGQIEADPALWPDTAQRLKGWSESTALFARLVPDCTIVPVRVSGVVAAATQRFWISRLRQNRRNREALAAMLQIIGRFINRRWWPISPTVEFLPPLPGQQVSTMSWSQLHKLLIERFSHAGVQSGGTADFPGANGGFWLTQ